MQKMRLFHFTNYIHWCDIQSTGEIATTESNIGSGSPDLEPYGEHIGPDVVWLTDKATPGANGLEVVLPVASIESQVELLEGATGRPFIEIDKRLVRLELDLDDAHHWPEWSCEHGINRQWARALSRDNLPWRWWVSERPIPVGEIAAVEIHPELADYIGRTLTLTLSDSP